MFAHLMQADGLCRQTVGARDPADPEPGFLLRQGTASHSSGSVGRSQPVRPQEPRAADSGLHTARTGLSGSGVWSGSGESAPPGLRRAASRRPHAAESGPGGSVGSLGGHRPSRGGS